ncbi:MAG: hypothetical protein IJH93_00805 [Lachnospiraceae bacterium]|nr:hypothetical protein [Lachnospiraceae bacterium]
MKKKIRKTIAFAAVLACLLCACGPEPGAGEAENAPLFGEDAPSAGDAGEEGDDLFSAPAGAEEADGSGQAAAEAAPAGQDPAGAGQTAAAAQNASGQESLTAAEENQALTRLDAETLQNMEDYLNGMENYGFLLSCYEKPEDIDLSMVFYSGAGYPQGKLEDKEEKLLLDRMDCEEFVTPVTKVPEDYIQDLLARKAGITMEESVKGLDGWSHIGRYHAYYHAHGDTNYRKVDCLDGWQQGDTFILHYREVPFASPAIEAAEKDGETGPAAAQTGETGTAAQAGTGNTAAQETAVSTAAEAATAAEETAESTAAEETAGDDRSAWYRPTYEVELKKTGSEYRFCSNILWVQKDLIEAQSYHAELEPLGDVFFAPFYPDTEADPMADVSFGLVMDNDLKMTLNPMEEGNVRRDRIFTGVDAVDFTDYNGDGGTDIITVCSYQLVDGRGNRTGETREARVYTMKTDPDYPMPLLDREKTEAVNSHVEPLNITNITQYLTGKSDGKAKKYSSWKEAYAGQLRSLNQDEYKGFALIHLNEGRTPAFVQYGATKAKGTTIVVYRNGSLDETWLNRRDFEYLEYENLLHSSSGIDNLSFDTIYSISRGRLKVSVQGYYGNRHFARDRKNADGTSGCQYFWEGGEVSRNGYRDGFHFVFDRSRAKKFTEKDLISAEEMLEKLK